MATPHAPSWKSPLAVAGIFFGPPRSRNPVFRPGRTTVLREKPAERVSKNVFLTANDIEAFITTTSECRRYKNLSYLHRLVCDQVCPTAYQLKGTNRAQRTRTAAGDYCRPQTAMKQSPLRGAPDVAKTRLRPKRDGEKGSRNVCS